MKRKYIAVPVSERLPEKEGEYLTNYDPILFKDGRFTDIYQSLTFDVDNWFEEVPDHSEEMLSLLEDVIILKPLLQYPNDVKEEHVEEAYAVSHMLYKIEKLLNKVKDNGK